MTWGGVAAGVGAVAGGLLSSSGSKTEGNTKTQLGVPEWMKGLPEEQINKIMELAGRKTPTAEEMVAPWTTNLTSGVQALAGYGATNNIDDMIKAAGAGTVGAAGEGRDVLNRVAGMGSPINQGPNMANVGAMINNPLLQSQIDAALRDPTRQLTEQQMPASRMAQAASGNTGSTRGAIGEAVLQRGYEDRAADVSAGIRGNAYEQALGLEANRTAQNAGLEGSYMNTLVGAGGTLGNIGTAGANMLNMSNAISLSDINSIISAGSMETAQDQTMRDAKMMEFLMPQQQADWASSHINESAEQYGVRVGQTQQKTPGNVAAGALQGASIGMGMFSNYQNSQPLTGYNPPSGGSSGFIPGFDVYQNLGIPRT